MPGVYVHSVKELGWVPTDKNSVIAIPGAYWLCHKQNIYKFIFRYHRGVRNVGKFEYGRELMKIIRKILKCQPNQGQQFGTQHLRVTYNHTSWTRQDKMFAILKFKDRLNAGAYSRAFVLTIRIFSSENLIPNIGYTVLTNDKNISLFSSNTRDSSGTIDSTSHPTIDLVEDDANPIQKNKQHKSDNHCYLSTISNTNDEVETAHNRSRERDKQNSKKLPKVMMNIRGEEKRRHVNRSRRKHRTSKSHVDNCNYETINFNSKETITISNEPNQYLIDKEIEMKKIQSLPISSRYRTKVLKGNGFLEMKENETDKLKPYNDKCKRKFFENFYKNKFNGRSKTIKDSSIKETNTRTSNITDLVMKGRMFTIAQNKDSVCVVEEKTKLEVDEVLENSVKVKTDKGEECLLNSSLLKLENLISKMELPKLNECPTNLIDSNDENFDLNDTVILDEDESNDSIFGDKIPAIESNSIVDEIDDTRSIFSGTTFVSEHIPFQRSSFAINECLEVRKKVDDQIIIENNICNVPRIVSCEIITLDQMCPALQNALRNKILNKNNNRTLKKCCSMEQNQDNAKHMNIDSELNIGMEPMDLTLIDDEKLHRKSNIEAIESSDGENNNEVIFENQLNENDIGVDQEQTLKTAIDNVPSLNILKFIADITRGAKVVVQRLTLSNNL